MTLADIAKNGVVGAGGAGFPTQVKLAASPEFLILNAAECEPLLHKDEEIVRHFTDEVVAGFRIAMELTRARLGIIGIKQKHQELIASLEEKTDSRIKIVTIGDFYPAGDEVTLVYLTTGRVVQPGELPISVACLVQNVETLLNVERNRPVVEKYLTVAGAVANPMTIKAPIGASLADVLSHFQITASSFVIRSGGLMMGELEHDLNAVITKTTGGLLVLPADHHLAVVYERYADPHQTVRIAKAGCDQCNFCTELCPRYLLGHPVRPETAMRNRMFSSGDENCFHPGNAFCCECNLCTLYACPEGLDPKGATLIEKRGMLAQGYQGQALPVKAHPMLDYRKAPTKSLMQRLDVMQYKDEAPLNEIEFNLSRVRIPLKQHIGAPAKSFVRIGDRVKKYDLIGEASGDISANVHASIDGVVSEITESDILLEKLS